MQQQQISKETANSKAQILQLCQKFQSLFTRLKEIRAERIQLEEENKHLQTEIDQDQENKQKSIIQYNMQKEELEQHISLFKNQLESINKNYEALDQNLNTKKNSLEDLENKKKLAEIQLEQSQNEIKESKKQLSLQHSELNRILKINEDLEQKEQQVKENYEKLAQNIYNAKTKIEEFNQKIDEIETSMKNNQIVREEKEEEFISSQRFYKENLKQGAELQQQIAQKEKDIKKSSDELQSKMQRLLLLLNHNATLNQKIKKLEEIRLNYQSKQDNNMRLIEETENLKQIFQQQQLQTSSGQGSGNKNNQNNIKLGNISASKINGFQNQHNKSEGQFKAKSVSPTRSPLQITNNAKVTPSLTAHQQSQLDNDEREKLIQQQFKQKEYLENLIITLKEKDKQMQQNEKELNDLRQKLSQIQVSGKDSMIISGNTFNSQQDYEEII